ncbi:MAG: hypothetical protein EPN92_07715 [Chitinophagaceae bacterium]|nr:MAG: hypothetical protein EPN92_07715 [Chitinophagaceae bacterium]
MEKNIPNTFTYYYVAGSTGGVDPLAGKYLLKAYGINPDFEGIQSNVVTYAQSVSDIALRKSVNKEWYKKNELSPGLLAYGYNVLMSLDPNSVLLTQHDNDSYPVWMLQDALGIRTDVLVINIDFLILDSYREKVFKDLSITPIDLRTKSINDYGLNWKTIVHHILTNYKNIRPLFLGLTLFPELYEDFSKKLFVSGLTLKYSDKPLNQVAKNKELFENLFLLDYLKIGFTNDISQSNVNIQNLNYFKSFKIVYDYYKSNKMVDNAKKIRELSLLIASKADDHKLIDKTKSDFK